MRSSGSVPATPTPSSWGLAICCLHGGAEARDGCHTWGATCQASGMSRGRLVAEAAAPGGQVGPCPWPTSSSLQRQGYRGAWAGVEGRAASGLQEPSVGRPRPWVWVLAAVFQLCNGGTVSALLGLCNSSPPGSGPASRPLRVGPGTICCLGSAVILLAEPTSRGAPGQAEPAALLASSPTSQLNVDR